MSGVSWSGVRDIKILIKNDFFKSHKYVVMDQICVCSTFKCVCAHKESG